MDWLSRSRKGRTQSSKVRRITGAEPMALSGTINGRALRIFKFYGSVLPHGEYEFTLDLATFVITFGNGAKANLLAPGTHTFIHGKTLGHPVRHVRL